MILYQFIFYVYLISCFTSLKSVSRLLHCVQYYTWLIGLLTVDLSSVVICFKYTMRQCTFSALRFSSVI